MGMTAAEKNRNGIREWVFQRITNALIVLYGIVMLGYFLSSGFSYESLTSLFGQTWFALYSLVTLAFACVNSVLAGWQIASDYSQKFGFSQSAMVMAGVVISAGYFVFGLMILF